MIYPYRMIYFFGADGTGKTTQANLAASNLRKHGFKVWRASIKQHHTFAYMFLKLMPSKNLQGESVHYYGFSDNLTAKIRAPWKILELASVFPALIYKIYIPMLLGYIVVCDRYLFDTLATLSYFLKDPRILSGLPSKILQCFIPKKSLLVLFEAENIDIFTRKQDEPLTLKLLEYYRQSYRQLTWWSGRKIITINTSKLSVKEVQTQMLTAMGF